jgi:(Z)-2-((N-methylformamido)methylene)-5-hydroxybutyrolactone dehydrogenase
MEEFLMRIGPDWRAAKSGQWFESLDPYTGENWARMPRGSADDVDAAVQVAHNAYRCLVDNDSQRPRTSAAPLGDRIAENAERLSDLEVKDNGKLKAEMLGQLKYLPQWFYYFSGLSPDGQGTHDLAATFTVTGTSIQLRFVTPDRAS